ncbi:hypothetical protein GCM10023322_30330 [Rugosimonospora acidiphila]|uniref:Uncharacterized protein n=1 Tax=Rugosimonospora acidiphila TaxID=556531 RepID=A0ABP9RTL2_9ACTN
MPRLGDLLGLSSGVRDVQGRSVEAGHSDPDHHAPIRHQLLKEGRLVPAPLVFMTGLSVVVVGLRRAAVCARAASLTEKTVADGSVADNIVVA